MIKSWSKLQVGAYLLLLLIALVTPGSHLIDPYTAKAAAPEACHRAPGPAPDLVEELTASISAGVVTEAADLRSVFGLLLGEHAVLMAKATDAKLRQRPADVAAAENMLDDSSLQLAAVFGALYGEDAQASFSSIWRSRSDRLFQYATALGTGDAAAAGSVLTGLAQDDASVAAFLATLHLELQAPALHQRLQDHTQRLVTVINVQARWTAHVSGDQQAAYPALQAAHASIDAIAGTLTTAAVRNAPERFAGEVAVGGRVQAELLVREHAFLVAASAAAALAARNIEFEAAAGALEQNAQTLARLIAASANEQSAAAFLRLWRKQNGLFINYVMAHVSQDKARQAQLRQELQQHAGDLGARFDAANANATGAQARVRMAAYVTTALGAIDAMAAGDIDAYYAALCVTYHSAPLVGASLATSMPSRLAAALTASQASLTPAAPAPVWRWAIQAETTVAVSVPVLIGASTFQPSRVEVPKGATVVWFNQDNVAHTLVAGTPEHETGLFRTTLIPPNGQFSLAFTQAGEYPYFSRSYDQIRGVVVVKSI